MKPKLRFKEFDDEWAEKKLGEIGRFIKGKGLSKKDIVDNGKYPCILYGELYTRYGEVINRVYSRTNYCESVEISIGDEVLIPSSGESSEEIAQASYLPYENVLLGGDINIFRTSENGVYISYFLNQNAKRLSAMAQGATVVHLYASVLGKVKVNFPSLPEQEKIGQFFSLLDDRIEKQEQKINLLKERKKGWMQKIFNQEIRFKDENGNDYPDWEEKKLGDIAKQVKTKNKKLVSDNVLTISAQYGLINQSLFFNKNVASKDLSGYYLLSKNDFAYNKSYSKDYAFGAIKRLSKYDQGVVSPLYICFAANNLKSNLFLEQYFESQKWNHYINGVAQEGARNHGLLNIAVKDFFDMPIQLPSLPEQEKIGAFLSKQDELIEKEEEKLNLLKEQKKGLLQQMFV